MQAIQADRDDVEEVNSWLYHDNYNCSLTQLRIVHITGIFGVKAELDLIRYLLLNSLVLEICTVKPASVDGSWDLVKKLLRFGRVSVHSEIIFLDPWFDQLEINPRIKLIKIDKRICLPIPQQVLLCIFSFRRSFYFIVTILDSFSMLLTFLP